MHCWRGRAAGRTSRFVTPSSPSHLLTSCTAIGVSLGFSQVTLIPTFDSLAMHQWYQETHDRQRELSVTVLGSNSTVAMQEETFPACKVEF